MCRYLVLLLLLGRASFALAQADPESVEPVLGYSLHVDDKVVRLTAGTPARLDGTFTNPTIKLVADDYRVFPYAGVSFRYPSHFTFDADFEEKALRAWSMSGNNCVIMLQRYSEQVSADDLCDSLLDQYGRENARISNVTIKLAGQTMKGKRITAKVASSTIVQDVFEIPAKTGATMILLQDSPNEDGTPSNERKFVEKQLTESFAAAKKAP